MSLSVTIRESLGRHPRERAVHFEDTWYSWAQIGTTVKRLEDALAQAALPHRARVGLVARNTPSFVAGLLTLIAGEYSIVMVYPFQSPASIAHDILAADLDAVIADARDWTTETIDAARELELLAVSIGKLENPIESLHQPDFPHQPDSLHRLDFPHQPDSPRRPMAQHGRERGEPVIELLTSGTTGRPKRISMSFAAIERAMVTETSQVSTVNPSTLPPALMMFPFGNISGLYSYLPMAAAARPVVLLEKFSVTAWVNFVREYRPAHMNVPPAGVRMILDAQTDPADLKSLRFMFSGAARLDPTAQVEFLQRYNVPILLSYGATEFGGVVTLMTPELLEKFGVAKLTSVGRPWAGTDLRVVDANSGAQLPPEQTGILEVKAPRCGPDWIRTTDLASIDADGFIYHHGRADGAINRGGFKIIPEIVADKLAQHPSVSAVAVVGIPDARLGEIPVAAVEPRAGAPRPSEQELRDYARANLPKTHVPVHFKIVDRIPRTPSLKVHLPGVRELFESDSEDTAS